MEYTKLGNTGLDVSIGFVLVAWGFGDPGRWKLAPWVLDEERSFHHQKGS